MLMGGASGWWEGLLVASGRGYCELGGATGGLDVRQVSTGIREV